jgi:hypothetical protein
VEVVIEIGLEEPDKRRTGPSIRRVRVESLPEMSIRG